MSLTLSAHALALTAFVSVVAWAAIGDVRCFRIPNRLVAAIVALYPAHVIASAAPVDWVGAFIAAALVFAGGAVLFRFALVGGGDVKLAAAVALWAGPVGAIPFLIVTSLAGGALALLCSGWARDGLIYGAAALGADRAHAMLLEAKIPYGLAIAVGGLFVAARLWGG